MIQHNKLIMIDDLRSIGHLACQASHTTEQLYKGLLDGTLAAEEQSLIEERIFNLNFERRLQQAEFLDTNGISNEYGTKGNYQAYCQAKHAIITWILAEEKFLGTQPVISDGISAVDYEKVAEYNKAQERFRKAYANMLSTVATWLGVKELTVCADCLADKLEIESHNSSDKSKVSGEAFEKEAPQKFINTDKIVNYYNS